MFPGTGSRQAAPAPWLDPFDALRSAFANRRQEVRNEEWEVFATVSERWDLDHKHRQAEEEVLPHAAGAHLGQRPIGRRNDPDIDLAAVEATDRANLPILEHPQKLRLRVQASSPTSSRNRVPRCAPTKRPA